jgi:hypothetical protein
MIQLLHRTLGWPSELAAQSRAVAAAFPKRGPPAPERRAELARQLARLRQHATELAAIDFFGAPGREVVVFRFRDEDNHYVARANALEDNVNLNHMVKGRRRQIKGWRGKVAPNAWHALAIEARGGRLQVFWEGQPIIDAKDDTFGDAGKVGVWTKADSVTHFAALTATPLG